MTYRSNLNTEARKRVNKAMRILASHYGEMELEPIMSGGAIKMTSGERKAEVYETWIDALGRYTEEAINKAVRDYIQQSKRNFWPTAAQVKDFIPTGSLHPDYEFKPEQQHEDYDEWKGEARKRKNEIMRKHIDDANFESAAMHGTLCKLGIITACNRVNAADFQRDAEKNIRAMAETHIKCPENVENMKSVLDKIGSELYDNAAS